MNLFLLIYRYLIGSLTIKITGEYCERFLNILAANSIPFWSTEKKNGKFYIIIFKKDIIKVKKLRKKALVKINIVKKHGFPKVLLRYKHRYGIPLGIVCFIIILELLSNFTWVIKVNGNEKNSELQVIRALNDLGVYAGVKTENINTDVIRQKLILSFDNISWASLNRQSSVLEVNIKEFEEEIVGQQEPCNLIASHDGIITEIKVRQGDSGVRIGQTVKKGQILVSGITSDNENTVLVHSSADIFASVPDSFEIRIPKTSTKKVYSDKTHKKHVLQLFAIDVPLFLGEEAEKNDSEYRIKNLTFNGRRLPISIYTEIQKPYKEISFAIDPSKVLSMAEEQLKQKLDSENASSFEVISSTVTEDESSYLYSAIIRKTINIAREEILKINDENS